MAENLFGLTHPRNVNILTKDGIVIISVQELYELSHSKYILKKLEEIYKIEYNKFIEDLDKQQLTEKQ